MKKHKQPSAIKQATVPHARQKHGRSAMKQPERKYAPLRIPSPVFFDLLVYEVCEDGRPCNWPCTHDLVAGHAYEIVLTGGGHSSTLKPDSHPHGVVIEEPVVLRVDFPTELQGLGLPSHREYVLSYHKAKALEEKFSIVVPEVYPTRTDIRFVLSYTDHHHSHPYRLGERCISIAGTYNLENPQLLAHCQIAERIPEDTVILRINAPHSTHSRYEESLELRLRGWGYYGKELDKAVTPEVIVSVAEFQRELQEEQEGSPSGRRRGDPLEMISRVWRFSRTFSPDLQTWLGDHYRQHQHNLCVVIVDMTTLEIPWEMVKLTAGHLGAIAQVVRWLPFQSNQPRLLRFQHTQHRGSAMTYLDDELGDDLIAAERRALKKLDTFQYAGPGVTGLEALELRMRQRLEDHIGLVYIGCHGLEGQHLQEGSMQHPLHRLKSINLEMLYEHSEPHLVVFANACESARIVRENRMDHSSFVEGFLTHCASGFIGTMASVSIRNASKIAERILEEALSPEGVRVAEILRRLRAQAVERLEKARLLPEGWNRKELFKVIDTFMYVYYGNPLARLHLRAANREEEGT